LSFVHTFAHNARNIHNCQGVHLCTPIALAIQQAVFVMTTTAVYNRSISRILYSTSGKNWASLRDRTLLSCRSHELSASRLCDRLVGSYRKRAWGFLAVSRSQFKKSAYVCFAMVYDNVFGADYGQLCNGKTRSDDQHIIVAGSAFRSSMFVVQPNY